MHLITYSQNAVKELGRITPVDAKRIVKKLEYFAKQTKPINYAKLLMGFKENIYRFRIGNYRAVFILGNKGELQIINILTIKHRKDIYKDEI
jgi:mRNA interferase RelE/StbE